MCASDFVVGVIVSDVVVGVIVTDVVVSGVVSDVVAGVVFTDVVDGAVVLDLITVSASLLSSAVLLISLLLLFPRAPLTRGRPIRGPREGDVRR